MRLWIDDGSALARTPVLAATWRLRASVDGMSSWGKWIGRLSEQVVCVGVYVYMWVWVCVYLCVWVWVYVCVYVRVCGHACVRE